MLNMFAYVCISKNKHIKPIILFTVMAWTKLRKKKGINLKLA